jgi:hypothetical protein
MFSFNSSVCLTRGFKSDNLQLAFAPSSLILANNFSPLNLALYVLEYLTVNDIEREELIKTSWELHSSVEAAYLTTPASKKDPEWLEKQRILLADMAIHLLQTAMQPGDIELDKLRNNIYAILTITDQFLPGAELKIAADKIYG